MSDIHQKIEGKCLIIFLIVMILLSFGAIWIVNKVAVMRDEKISKKKILGTTENFPALDWKIIAENLNTKYQGKILHVMQLNPLTCRVSVSPNLSGPEMLELAKKIGMDIRSSIAGVSEAAPTVRLFVNGKLVATAKFSEGNYISEISP
ncbi:MAG: hypothetical protein HY809_07575 [Nitrospirae bacterium]|nr:hypothetical protein [Nitrospirota bacterium]